MKFDCDWPAGLRDIHVWKCERTDARTPARLHPISSHRAFGSGELKKYDYTELTWVYSSLSSPEQFYFDWPICVISGCQGYHDVHLCISIKVCWYHTGDNPIITNVFAIQQHKFGKGMFLFSKFDIVSKMNNHRRTWKKITELSLGFWKQEFRTPICQKVGVPLEKVGVPLQKVGVPPICAYRISFPF